MGRTLIFGSIAFVAALVTVASFVTGIQSLPDLCTHYATVCFWQAPHMSSDFIFADSDRRLLTREEVVRLTPAQMRIARNEIFARRGRYFQSDDLKQRFTKFAWYHPATWNPPLNATEEANVKLIENAEAGH